MNIEKLQTLRGALFAIKSCTQAVENHTDPKSIQDCWHMVDEIVAELKVSSFKGNAKLEKMLDKEFPIPVNDPELPNTSMLKKERIDWQREIATKYFLAGQKSKIIR